MPREGIPYPRVANRRTVLKQTAVASAFGFSSLAGCIGDNGDDDPGTDDEGVTDDDATDDTDDTDDGDDTDEEYAEVEMAFASSYEPDHPIAQAADRFGEIMAEETDGAFEVELVAGGAYGGEEEITSLCREGVVEAHADSRWPYVMYTPDYEFINVPVVFDDYDHLVRVSESDEFQPAHEGIREEGNQRMIGNWLDRGLRWYTSNEPVREPADVQGHDLRLPPLDQWVAIWEEIGANPTTVALDELYSALQTGVVEASEGDIPQIHSFNLQEVQDYISFTGHHVQVGALYMNEDFYQDLDESYQELIDEAAITATDEISENVQNDIDGMIDDLSEEAEIVEDVDQEAFTEAARPVVEEMFDDFEGSLDDWQEI